MPFLQQLLKPNDRELHCTFLLNFKFYLPIYLFIYSARCKKVYTAVHEYIMLLPGKFNYLFHSEYMQTLIRARRIDAFS